MLNASLSCLYSSLSKIFFGDAMAYSVRPISQVCEELLKIYYGDVATSVGRYLLRRGNRSVGDIVSATGLSRDETKKALVVLIPHNVVKFQESVSKQNVKFSDEIQNINHLLHFPKYLYTMKRIFGKVEGVLVEVLRNQGQINASNIIFLAAKRLIEVHECDGQLLSIGACWRDISGWRVCSLISRLATEEKLAQVGDILTHTEKSLVNQEYGRSDHFARAESERIHMYLGKLSSIC